jgi:hypothetical protein
VIVVAFLLLAALVAVLFAIWHDLERHIAAVRENA